MTIVTHPGEPHRDDLYASAFLLAMYPDATLYRRDATPEDLSSHDVIVVDQGGQHDPLANNFDHHQMVNDPLHPENPCAFTLVAQHFLGLTKEEQEELWPWARALSIMDNYGPYCLAKVYGGSDPDLVYALAVPPGEGFMLSQFRDTPVLLPHPMDSEGCLVREMLEELGHSLIQQATEYKELRDKDWTPSLFKDGLAVYDRELSFMEKKFVNTFLAKVNASSHEVVAVASHDDRGDGWSMIRFDDHPNFNTKPLQDDERVLFAHNGGFILKTNERLDEEALCALYEDCLTK
jgi:hypothetical protein